MVTAGTPTTLCCITYANGYFVAVAASPPAIVYSTDGMTWNLASDTIGGNDITYHNGMFITAVYPGFIYMATDPAGTWTEYRLLDELGIFNPWLN